MMLLDCYYSVCIN
uniref:Uncharacterized protein n=1 Tax=Arundo donax TaxID=35708 RepID=A0A0A9HKN9_ARUDO